MPPKRKAPVEPLPSEPSRRKLRSDGPVTPAKPLPKPGTTARATRRPVANGKPHPEVPGLPEPVKRKPEARATRYKTATGLPKAEKAPSKRATKKTTVVPIELDPATEVGTAEALKRRGRPPGVRPTVAEEQAVQVKPPSKKPPPRGPTRTTTRAATAKVGSSKSTTKTSQSRATRKNVPRVVEEEPEEQERDEEPGAKPVPSRSTTPIRPRVIMDAVEIVTPNRHHPFSSNQNTPIRPRSSPVKSPSTLPPVISVEPTRPPHNRIPPPASPGKRGKRRRDERSPSPESLRLPSPSKRAMRSGTVTTPGATTKFPADYHTCLQAQKRVIMAALRNPPEIDMEGDQDEIPSANELAYGDLCGLLTGSVVRGEGNSCLLIGPRGSGKTRVC